MWFRKKADAAEVTMPVTLDRLEEAMKRKEWSYERHENYLSSIFESFGTVIELGSENRFFSVYVWSSAYYDDGSRFDEALAWAEQWNENTIFGTARPYVDDDGDLMMRVDTSMLTLSGLSDEQLDEFLDIAIACGVQAVDAYVKDLGIEEKRRSESDD
ncbi:YbjN domain-containing protein [Schaalia canis]|uniref:YbjN domain-containing protein n=1 Tax=Schaalia canis TaxID=100469 RepID=A0A3P1SHR7_9ACTO|nr:YbjN domain-containing protein [Schaalia canis]RRC96315.1 YbjN domain-containing protein [Schaalia canis]